MAQLKAKPKKWNTMTMIHNYDFKTGKIEDEPIIKSMNKTQTKEYMILLQWFDDNPMTPISVSDAVFSRKER